MLLIVLLKTQNYLPQKEFYYLISITFSELSCFFVTDFVILIKSFTTPATNCEVQV